VTAEDDWWGARAAEGIIASARGTNALVGKIFESYYLRAPSPRVSPAAAADSWFQKTVQRRIDGVVFYLPPDDDVYGWDYPRQRDFVKARGIPSLLIREDAGVGLSRDASAEIQSFVQSAKRSRRVPGA
jgi:hypothetical protein